MNTATSKTKFISTLVMASIVSLCFMTSPLYAHIIATKTRTAHWVYGGATYNMKWTNATGSHIVKFNTNQNNTRVVITFNAECAVEGAPNKWLDIDIMVDPAGPQGPKAIAPSNGDNAFCSGNGTTTATPSNFTLDGWVSAVTQATVVLPKKGQHKVWVLVKGAHSGLARLDDMSLVVQR